MDGKNGGCAAASEKGFTLVEVLASVVIISLILSSFFGLLVFTNKTAVSNNSKLVSINLAKASMERMKIQPESYFHFTDVKEKTYTIKDCLTEECEALYELPVNDQKYDVEVKVSQSEEEKNLQLINVVVTVELAERNIQSTVEGYISHATFEE